MNAKYISKIFSGAVFSGLIMLALFGISAFDANAQNNTRKVTVKKDVCSSINPTTNAVTVLIINLKA
jgi:ABC-type spermidine/putrescine transport system permease subunit II